MGAMFRRVFNYVLQAETQVTHNNNDSDEKSS